MRNEFCSFLTSLLNLAVASKAQLNGLTKFRGWCTEKPTVVRNRLLAVAYTSLDQRVPVTAKFGDRFTIRYAVP